MENKSWWRFAIEIDKNIEDLIIWKLNQLEIFSYAFDCFSKEKNIIKLLIWLPAFCWKKNKKSAEFKKLEELIERQNFIKEDSFEPINRNKDLIKLHSNWLDAYVELQPFKLKKKFLENKLKVLVGENQGIKDICSWKREKKKQITKNSLLKFDPELANKYISIGESQIRFKVNDFRPYHFD